MIHTNSYRSIDSHKSLHAPDEAVEELRRGESQQEETNTDFNQRDSNVKDRLADEIEVEAIFLLG